jgi:acetyl esterase/lipase
MGIRIEKDIVFGHARTGYRGGQGPMRDVALKLDAYLPVANGGKAAPALVMAFGGAFHRGSKESDAFSDGHGTSTAVAEYCRRFAALGVPSFSVEYRLAQADPEPGARLLTEPDRVPMSRINPVRAELGLGPIEPRAMAGIMEAAFDDVADAVGFVKAQADDFGIDPNRIVLGGFSAGGRCAMYGAFGKRIEVAGVIALSGPMVPVDAAAFLEKGGKVPPLLMVSGERDLDYVREFVPEIDRQFRASGHEVDWAMVPGATHFYAAEAITASGNTVFEVMLRSLDRWAGPIGEEE